MRMKPTPAPYWMSLPTMMGSSREAAVATPMASVTVTGAVASLSSRRSRRRAAPLTAMYTRAAEHPVHRQAGHHVDALAVADEGVGLAAAENDGRHQGQADVVALAVEDADLQAELGIAEAVGREFSRRRRRRRSHPAR
jgi:hypothetical protein